MIKGFALNNDHLRLHKDKIVALEKTVTMLSNLIDKKSLTADEATGLLRVITDYTFALDLLDRYDHQTLVIEQTSGPAHSKLTTSWQKKQFQNLENKLET